MARIGCVFGVVGVAMASTGGAMASDPWADHVVSYTAGTGVDPGYTNPASALGMPTRFTGIGSFPGAVTPFNPAFLGSELVSIGPGGSLVVRFDEPALNNPANPFGIDLLIFGNAGYADVAYPAGVAGPMFGAGGGVVELSSDGFNWVTAPGAIADGRFPTLGYSDLTDPYSLAAGAVPSDFTRPVDPAFSPAGLNFSQIVAGYAGSGGGTGIDIAAAGLASVSYVRISNPVFSQANVDVDALAAVVPGPAGWVVLMVGAAGWRRRRANRGPT